MKKLEKKYFPFHLTKFDEQAGLFSGYASVFGVEDAYREMVDMGAFKKTLKERKRHKLLWNHEAGLPGIGYSEPTEDDRGLLIEEGQLYLDIQRAKEAYINMKNDTLDGLSIGFQTMKDWIDPKDGIRHLKEIALWEISLCNFQACPGAVIGEVKALELKDILESIRSIKSGELIVDSKAWLYETKLSIEALLEGWEPESTPGIKKSQELSKPEILHLLDGYILAINQARKNI